MWVLLWLLFNLGLSVFCFLVCAVGCFRLVVILLFVLLLFGGVLVV